MDIHKPQRIAIDVEQTGADLVLRRRSGSLGFGVFLAGLLVPWTILDVILLAGVSGWPSPIMVLVCLPLYAFWPLVVLLAAGLLTGQETLRIGPAGVELRGRSWIGKSQRQVPLEEIRGLARERHLDRLPWNPPEILTWGEPIGFGGSDSAEVSWLTTRIEDTLRDLLAARSKDGPLSPPDTPPADSSLRIRHRGDSIVLDGQEERGVGTILGRFAGVGCAGTLTWFVIGLAGSSIVATRNQPSLGGFVLSTLGGVVALLVSAQFIGAVLTMFGRRTCTFTPDELTVRVSVFGVGWTSRHPEWRLRRAEVVAGQRRQSWPDPMIVRLEDDESFPLGVSYSLNLPDRDGKILDDIYLFEMTPAEARWLIRLLCDQFQGTPSKGGSVASFLAPEPATLWDRELDH